jgi:hypothetical protein
MSLTMIPNPFKLFFQTANAITGTARNLYTLLFLVFLAIPSALVYCGPRFTSESVNCLLEILWLLIPFIMLGAAMAALSIWRIVASTAFLVAWVPLVVFSCSLWTPLIEGFSKNHDPVFKLVNEQQQNKTTSIRRYKLDLARISIRKETLERELFPGLKWVEIREQRIEN